jgi:hypothetical protein
VAQYTYGSTSEADGDRAQQKLLLVALGAWERALRRDGCSGWSIIGKNGTIHTWGDGKTWALYVRCRSAQHWTWTKKKLSFCNVSQDGDDEGVLRLHQQPTPAQANVIRDTLGIQKRKEVSAEGLERLRSLAFERASRSEASVDANIGSGEPSPPDTRAPDQTPIFDTTPAK